MMIRDVCEPDRASWLRLWNGYLRFYEAFVPSDVTEGTWRRLLDPDVPIVGRVAVRDREIVGMTVSVLHEGSWTLAPICYLEDLFVDPSSRSGGIGRALLQDLIETGRERGWSRVYWHTRADNAAARRLYDQFTSADDFVRYRLILR